MSLEKLLDLWVHREYLKTASGSPRMREAGLMAAAYSCGHKCKVKEIYCELLATECIPPETISHEKALEIARGAIAAVSDSAARLGMTPAEQFDLSRLIAAVMVGVRSYGNTNLLDVDRCVREEHEARTAPGDN